MIGWGGRWLSHEEYPHAIPRRQTPDDHTSTSAGSTTKQESTGDDTVRYIPAISGLAIVVTGGLLHGFSTDRWGRDLDLEQAAGRLTTVPQTLGAGSDWVSEEVPTNSRQLAQAEALGHFSRRFVKRGDGTTSNEGASVNVLVLCGRMGPIAVHPPTVCFTNSGLHQEKPEERYVVTGTAGAPLGEFFHSVFSRNVDGVPMRLQTFWAWYGPKGFQAPDNPRLAFAGEHFLYKIYVTRLLSADEPPLDESPCVEFLRAFLPALQQHLTPDKQ